jgi:ATP-dependent RNA helicase DeaD
MAGKLFSELGLSPELLKAIDNLGFEQASPIQAEAIPLLMQGLDVVGQSMTGSGKTAAFAVPAIEKVDVNQKAPQVLVLCPTRELAVQVAEEVHKLSLFKRGIHALPIYGGQSYDRQLYGLRQGAQIIIGTPGRVMDHMRRGTLRFASLKMVILDEVDVMLNMGFRDDIETILQDTPKERQTVFFSATIPRPIQQLIEKHARDPRNIRIEQKALTVPTVEQVYYEVDRRFKIELLTRLIDMHDLRLGIVFCNTKRMVDDLVDHLNAQGYSADRLHGDMTQMMRDRVMNKFRKSGLEFLVATDVAARGIDVDDVEVVFNYDLPYDGEDYVHRIGRTGRKGRSGLAISFASGREVFQIRNIERYTNVRIHRGKPPSAGEVEEARANAFLDKLRATLKAGEFKRQDHLVERLLEEGFNSTDIASALLHHLQSADGVTAAKSKTSGADQRMSSPREAPPGGGNGSRPARAVANPALRPAPERPQPQAAPQRSSPKPAPHTPPRNPAAQDATPPRDRAKPSPQRERTEMQTAVGSAPKPSRRIAEGQTRLYINIGNEMGIVASDVVGAILGETGLPAKVVGTLDVRERHLFVDVASEHVRGIVAKLNRALIKGRRVKVKVA